MKERKGGRAKKRKRRAMMGRRMMSRGGLRNGDDEGERRRGMEVVGGGGCIVQSVSFGLVWLGWRVVACVEREGSVCVYVLGFMWRFASLHNTNPQTSDVAIITNGKQLHTSHFSKSIHQLFKKQHFRP